MTLIFFMNCTSDFYVGNSQDRNMHNLDTILDQNNNPDLM